jgi:hypothetical protein
MLLRDKDVILAFEESTFWACGTVVAILDGGNHLLLCLEVRDYNIHQLVVNALQERP